MHNGGGGKTANEESSEFKLLYIDPHYILHRKSKPEQIKNAKNDHNNYLISN